MAPADAAEAPPGVPGRGWTSQTQPAELATTTTAESCRPMLSQRVVHSCAVSRGSLRRTATGGSVAHPARSRRRIAVRMDASRRASDEEGAERVRRVDAADGFAEDLGDGELGDLAAAER